MVRDLAIWRALYDDAYQQMGAQSPYTNHLYPLGFTPLVASRYFQYPIGKSVSSSQYYGHGQGLFEAVPNPNQPNAVISQMSWVDLEEHLSLLGWISGKLTDPQRYHATNNNSPWQTDPAYAAAPYTVDQQTVLELNHPEFGLSGLFNPRDNPAGWLLGQRLLESLSGAPTGSFSQLGHDRSTAALNYFRAYVQRWVNILDPYIDSGTTGRPVAF